jgi:glycosyltransferase involved in cell wall biosynthesis
MAGGVERVLTLKANYFAEHFGYDITIILTEGKDKPLFYPLSDKIKVINLDINFEELWTCSFVKKVYVYLAKQRIFKKRLTAELMRIRPDITISLLRREINFINDIKDGSKKIGELHINRANYRNFDNDNTNFFKNLFSKFWMNSLLSKLKRLDRLVVLTEKDKEAWLELNNVVVIPNPLPFFSHKISRQSEKRVIAVGRYSHEKGYDLLLQAWSEVQKKCPDWRLDVFGDGDRQDYEQIIDHLQIDRNHCNLHGRTSDVQSEYEKSSLAVCSSRFEGFGLAIIEAMSCGLPVVSFDCPWGPRSIISDSQYGILVENGNVEKLAEGIVKLIDNRQLRMMMASHAVQNVQRFQLEEIAFQWKSLFESIVTA